MDVALVDDEIVSSGDGEFEAYKKAKEKYPDKKISLIYIPTEEETVTLLWSLDTQISEGIATYSS